MSRQDIRLADRYDLTKDRALLNGTQALVRLMLTQKERDRRAGLNTAGFVTGYRGSPLGAVDLQMMRAGKALKENDILFQSGQNEDLAATALWGSQQAELRGEGKFDGVFGLWYGKGPGVDRTGDAMRHANFAGTSAHGGVLMAMGDDHTGESSTTLHQSDFALVDVHMPVVSPAGVQEILDFGLYGFALSRFSGLWVGLKSMKDTIEATAIVDGRPGRMSLTVPEFLMPEGGLNIRLGDHWVAQEQRLIDHKRFAAEAFARENKIDKRVWGAAGAKIGIVAAGKNWLDLVHALSLLGLDAEQARQQGITTYKVGQTWPLDMTSFHDWAEGLSLIIVVEEKRKLIEVQIKEAIFDDRRGRRVYGWHKDGQELFPVRGALEPVDIAQKLGAILIEEGRRTDRLEAALADLDTASAAGNATDLAARLPYFCAGCPHNTSTRIPDGSRAGGGIGCHTMALWMDRGTEGLTHMGAEGANWIGEAPFSKRDHVFQNLGDGTYNHSGILAIRAALSANVNITYKILFNDAVAMTGGQANEGGLTADRIAREVLAMGVSDLAVVYDPKEELDRSAFPPGVAMYTRDHMGKVQREFSKIKGVSVILYVQTCAAEKRRRRKRGEYPDPDARVFINTDICEGCGDCGVQSNCVAILPVETSFGRKRMVDQSNCNKDFSCIDGFCPSFVTVKGAKLRKTATRDVELPDLPAPDLPQVQGTWNVVITGVGGTGAVTIGATLAMAAHLEDKGAAMMEMAGLAQKGGSVHIHLRLAARPEDISAVRVALGEADAVIGGDLVTTAGAKTLGLMRRGRTGAVVNGHDAVTGAFTRDTEFRLPHGALRLALEAKLKERLRIFDATEAARALMGDTIFANMMVLGAAWQAGLVPLGRDAIFDAIALNGAAPERNQRAFDLGRWAYLHPQEAAQAASPDSVAPSAPSLEQRIDERAAHLTAYQGPALARRYRQMVMRFEDATLRAAVVDGYHKLLSYKDEYEVARLHRQTLDRARAEFDGDLSLTYHLAPPLLARTGPDGRPVKRAFGPWIERLWGGLARLKMLRGTPFDPFGYSAERRMERHLIQQYEADMAALPDLSDPAKAEAARELAALPLQIRGFGPVKQANAEAAARRRTELKAILGGHEGARSAA